MRIGKLHAKRAGTAGWKRRIAWSVALFLLCAAGLRAQESPKAVADALGATDGTPVANGFVFIEGRYIAPPYTVTRTGNGIFINGELAEITVPWARAAAAVDATAGSGASPAASPETAPKDEIDTLFDPLPSKPSGTPPVEAEPAVPAKPIAPGRHFSTADEAMDALFGGSPAASGDAEKTVVPRNPSEKEPNSGTLQPRTELGTREGIQQMRKSLDAARLQYELALNRGEIFFFGKTHARINGNYGTARTMMEALPDALRASESAEDLLARLQRAGVHFIDAPISRLIFKNKATYPVLQERLRQIRQKEAYEASRRKTE